MFDLVYVCYNSEKWVEKCFSSLLHQNYDTKKLNVYIVDNASKDGTVDALEEFKRKHPDDFGAFEILKEDTNWGFGKANNLGFSKGQSDVVCFLNIDTEVFADTFLELEREAASANQNTAVWEFRQFPYEHPKLYDILTGETTWVSGAAFAVRRDVYKEVGGFDEKIFMYGEDVDLSWRIRAAGYKLVYAPRVIITHYSYTEAGEVKPTQHVYSLINNLLLRSRFSGPIANLRGHLAFWKHVIGGEAAFKGAKWKLIQGYFANLKRVPHFYAKGKFLKRPRVGQFIGWDYTTNPDGAFYENVLPDEEPLVSILVRTCGRPSVLRETLISLQRQTYQNIEVVVVEDGKPTAESMIKSEFSDMNILYHSTGKNVGRSKAGNLAMQLAHGTYLNFLDDDDLFFADHVEVLVANLIHSNCRAAYATSFETPIVVKSRDPYQYEITDCLCVHKQKFDRLLLFHHNYIPIQCIMFEKSLFEEYGGLAETVDALEDWDLWLRYSLYTDFEFVHKTTSVYRVPADKKINESRQEALDEALIVMRKKHENYFPRLSVADYLRLLGGNI